MRGIVWVMLTFELPDLIATSHLVRSACTTEAVVRISLFWLIVLFVLFYSCISILFFLFVLRLRIRALLGLFPLPLCLDTLLGDNKAVVASLGPGECDLVLYHTLPMTMGDPSTILDGKWETLSLCLIPGLIDKLPQLFLILVRSINVLYPKQDGCLSDRHA